MPRVMFVVNNPVFGGGQGQFIRLREPLAARGWDVIAVTPQGADAAQRLRAGGVEVEEVPLHRLRAKPDPRLQLPFLWSMPREIGGLRRLIERRGIDVVQAHGDTNPHAALAAHHAGVAVVWQIYDTVTPPPLRRVTMPVVTRIADVVTTWGRQLGLDYPGTASLGPRWIPVFPPVAEDTFVVTPERRAAARAELGLPPDAIAVALVGMRNPSKGHDHFVRSFARARESSPLLHARMLGPASPAHEDYERGFRAEAERLGLMQGGVLDILDAGARVPELLPAFDLLALSSVPRSEGMPTVILEAMACGLPVVATNVGAVAEEVADGQTGLIVPPLDEDAFAGALVRLAGDAQLRARMGAAGRERFEQSFRLDVLADVHVQAFELAREHRRSRKDSAL
jgi:glycosyltransferase involved in cell wall biosynthesis